MDIIKSFEHMQGRVWLNKGSSESLQASNSKPNENQWPKGINRSAVLMPCFFDAVNSHIVAGQRFQ